MKQVCPVTQWHNARDKGERDRKMGRDDMMGQGAGSDKGREKIILTFLLSKDIVGL